MVHLTAPTAGASPMSPNHLFDVTIIGGGPVGLFAAFYAGLRQMTTKVIDSLEELGGQLTALYPEKYVFDVAGFPKVYARDLAKNLIQQALEYTPTISLGETVKTLTPLKTAEDAKNVQTGLAAVARYALPNPKPAIYVFTVRPVADTAAQRGTVQPAFGQPGGGVELRFPDGTAPRTVIGPDQIPERQR